MVDEPLSAPRVAFLLPNLEVGGAERVVLTLAERFLAAGHPVDLVLFERRGPFLGEVPAGVRVVSLETRVRPLALRGLRRYLMRERPAAFVSGMAPFNCLAMLAWLLTDRAVRMVLVEHAAFSPFSERHWRWRLLRPLMARLYPRAAQVIAVSHGVAEDLAVAIGLAPARIATVYNPVITPRLAGLRAEALSHPWFAPGAPPVVLGVGRLVEQKDFSLLIRAFAALLARRPCRLMILGDGPERGKLEALVARLGIGEDVALPGFVANPMPYYREAAVFALSSQREGLASVIIEALACGIRVVATDCTSSPREVLGDGRHGRVVPLGDVPAMAAALEAALAEAETGAPPPCPDLSVYEAETVFRRYRALLLPDHGAH